ncbi:hypothetical protein EHS25_003973 [Saitozyma podzolica]|uniref:Uncharacterized protein n=1 Tax=Saitozyma podzolica TaxID=1890683 RepID=A0A427YSS7_9TREE|nr:hypothetical protein EHS25_003973 [Saitozyma podzolica]
MHGRNGCGLHLSPLLFAERADPGETHSEGKTHGPAKGEPKGVADVTCPDLVGEVADVRTGVEDESQVDLKGDPPEDGSKEHKAEEQL